MEFWCRFSDITILRMEGGRRLIKNTNVLLKYFWFIFHILYISKPIHLVMQTTYILIMSITALKAPTTELSLHCPPAAQLSPQSSFRLFPVVFLFLGWRGEYLRP